MDNIYFIHDASDSRLVVKTIPESDDIEEAVRLVAELEHMHWNDCSWGGVRGISVTI
jgi:hypothetical protein